MVKRTILSLPGIIFYCCNSTQAIKTYMLEEKFGVYLLMWKFNSLTQIGDYIEVIMGFMNWNKKNDTIIFVNLFI